MTTAIIGLGNMGKGLTGRLAGKTDLVVASRNLAEAQELAKGYKGVRAASVDDAVAAADVVILALPFATALDVAGSAKLAGKTVVDISNPVKADFSGLSIGHSTSAAEEIAKAAKGANVVKAFNTIFAHVLAQPASTTAGVQVFVAGDDEGAVGSVADLIEKAGFKTAKVGGLDGARLVEPVGMLNIRLGYGLGQGTAIAPAWLSTEA